MQSGSTVRNISEGQGKSITMELTEKQWGYDRCPQCGAISKLDLEPLASPAGFDWDCNACGARNHSVISYSRQPGTDSARCRLEP